MIYKKTKLAHSEHKAIKCCITESSCAGKEFVTILMDRICAPCIAPSDKSKRVRAQSRASRTKKAAAGKRTEMNNYTFTLGETTNVNNLERNRCSLQNNTQM